MEGHRMSLNVIECHGRSRKVPVRFLWTFDLGFGTWIWDLNLGLDLGLTIRKLDWYWVTKEIAWSHEECTGVLTCPPVSLLLHDDPGSPAPGHQSAPRPRHARPCVLARRLRQKVAATIIFLNWHSIDFITLTFFIGWFLLHLHLLFSRKYKHPATMTSGHVVLIPWYESSLSPQLGHVESIVIHLSKHHDDVSGLKI